MTTFDHERDWDAGTEPLMALVVAHDDAAAAAAVKSVDLAGARMMRRVGWAEAATAIETLARGTVVLVEAQDVEDSSGGDSSGGDPDGEDTDGETLTVVLSAIERRIAGGTSAGPELVAIVALGDWQIDAVGAALLGRGAQLLCAPTMSERVTALVLASSMTRPAMSPGAVADGEAEQLERLTAEIARIAEVLARLARREPTLRRERGSVADRRPGFDAGPDATPDVEPDGIQVAVDPRDVRRVIRARRSRDQQFGVASFGGGLFEDPAWDMMLDLFAAHLEDAQVSVSSLCIASAVAPTTALRWIGKMTDAGLFVRTPDPFDRRRAFVTLSRRTLATMRAHVAALARAGLPLA